MSVNQIKKKYIKDEAVDGLKLLLLNNQTVRRLDENGDPVDELQRLQSAIDAEKARVDAILAGAGADQDSFAEIISYVNSVDMVNDNALAAAVLDIEGKINVVEASSGLEADGSYLADMLTNYLQAATSFKNADSLLDAQIKVNADAIAQEVVDRGAADDVLQTNIDQEVSDREAADNAIKGDLSDAVYSTIEGLDDALAQEVSDRESGDDALRGVFDGSEVHTTIKALDGGLAQELLDRAAADTTLQGNIDTVSGALDQEVIDREAGDNAIKGDLSDAIHSTIEALDDALAVEEGHVNTLQGDMSQAQTDITSNTNAINTEVSDRQSEITRVEGLVSTEEAARILGDSNLSSEIATERGRIDNMLALADMDKDTFKEIADLIAATDLENDNDLVAAVNTINNNIAAEESARISADNVLSAAISTEESSRQAQDTILQGNIDTVSGNLATEISDRESGDDALRGVFDSSETYTTIKGLNDGLVAEENARGVLEGEFDAYVISNNAALAQEVSDRGAGDDAIKGDLSDAVYSTIEGLDDALAQEVSDRSSADTTLQNNIDTVSGDFSSFLSGDFATEQGNIDTLQVNLAQETQDRINGDNALQSQIDDITGGLNYEKDQFTLDSDDITNQYVDLSYEVPVEKYDAITFFVGRLAGHRGLDYTVSTVGGVSRITFAGSFASGGDEEMVAGDVVTVQYIR